MTRHWEYEDDPLGLAHIEPEDIAPLSQLDKIENYLTALSRPGGGTVPYMFANPQDRAKVQVWVVEPRAFGHLLLASQYVDLTEKMRQRPTDTDLADRRDNVDVDLRDGAVSEALEELPLLSPGEFREALDKIKQQARGDKLEPLAIGRRDFPEAVVDGTPHYRKAVAAYNGWKATSPRLAEAQANEPLGESLSAFIDRISSGNKPPKPTGPLNSVVPNRQWTNPLRPTRGFGSPEV